MKLKTFISTVQKTVLKQLAINADTSVVVSLVNLGLIELYKRFPLSTDEFVFKVLEDQSYYETPEDFMWLVTAYGEIPEGRPDYSSGTLAVNDEDNPNSINTVGYNMIQVPSHMKGKYISVIYAKAPAEMDEADLDAVIKIPPQLVEALVFYVGYMGQSSLKQTTQEEDSVLYRRFEASCAKVTTEGMLTRDSVEMRNRINDRGFV